MWNQKLRRISSGSCHENKTAVLCFIFMWVCPGATVRLCHFFVAAENNCGASLTPDLWYHLDHCFVQLASCFPFLPPVLVWQWEAPSTSSRAVIAAKWKLCISHVWNVPDYNNNSRSDIIPRGHTHFMNVIHRLFSPPNWVTFVFGESDESLTALDGVLMMLSNSLLLRFTWLLAAAQGTQDGTHWALHPLPWIWRLTALMLLPLSAAPWVRRGCTHPLWLLLASAFVNIRRGGREDIFEQPLLISKFVTRAVHPGHSSAIVDKTSKSRCSQNCGDRDVSDIHFVCCSEPLWKLTSCWCLASCPKIQVFQPVVLFDPMEIRNRVLYPGNKFVARWQIKKSWDQRLRVAIPHE